MEALKAAIDECGIEDLPNETVRVCNIEDNRETVDSLAVSEAAKQVLYEDIGFDERPSDADLVHRHIQKAFLKPVERCNSRFRKGAGALYSSFERETAESEARYYCRRFFYQPGQSEPFEFDVIRIAIFTAEIVDITTLCSRNFGLMSKSSYETSQFAGEYISRNFDGLTALSARCKGKNQAAFNPQLTYVGSILGRTCIEVKVRGGRKLTYVRRVT